MVRANEAATTCNVRVSVIDLVHEYTDAPSTSGSFAVNQFVVKSGEHRCLVGKSGAGKTTLFNVISGILTPTRGEVKLGDTSLHELSESERDRFRAREIGVVFQTSNLLQGLTLLENLTLAQHFAGQKGESARRASMGLLERLGLEARCGDKPRQLSVGELQRVGIARAICKNPSLVLADEPTASLDDETAAAAIELLLQECQGRTLIVASHDSRLIDRFEGSVSALENL